MGTEPFLGSENLGNLSEVTQLERAEQDWKLVFLAFKMPLVWEYTPFRVQVEGIDLKEKNGHFYCKGGEPERECMWGKLAVEVVDRQ